MNIKITITPELIQDLESYGINIEDELVSVIRMEEERFKDDMKNTVFFLQEIIRHKFKKIIMDHCQ